MPELPKPQSEKNSRQSNKRLIIFGVVLICVFVAWIVTMMTGSGFGR